MKISALLVVTCAQAAALVLSICPSHAIDLSGAWATDANVCEKIFAKAGKGISFKRNSGLYGGGFIVDGNAIRGQSAKCSIHARKEDGAVTHLVAVCTTDVMVGKNQFSFKTVDDNKIIRLFPGMEDMEIPYSRCVFKM